MTFSACPPKNVLKNAICVFLLISTWSVYSQTTDLIISEYAEGSSYNKYVEIYNGTGGSVDLSNYEIWKITNGGDWYEQSLTLSGVLLNNEVLVICHGSADAEILSKSDMVSGILSFNGDDAIGLAKNSVLIDAVGKAGADPGSGWEVAGVGNATKDHTLIRKNDICNPNVIWDDAAQNEWTVAENNNWTNLGLHKTNCQTEPVFNPPPLIDNIVFTPTNPDTSNTITIRAKITDDSKIDTAFVKYGNTPNELTNSMGMSTSSGDYFQSVIPAQKPGNFFFKIEAKDSAAAVSTSEIQTIVISVPPLGVPAVLPASQIINNGFVANWTAVPGAEEYLIDVSENNDFEQSSKANPNGFIISEIVEGSEYNKAVELFNGTGIPILLDDYILQRDFNGDGNFIYEQKLSGILGNGETFVICHPSASSEIKNKSELESAVCSFNGNDQIRLLKNTTVVDFFGRPGDKEIGKDITFIRYDYVSQASANFKPVEWKKLKKDNFDFLGTHSMKDAVPNIFLDSLFMHSTEKNTSFEIKNLQALSNYYYRVRARNKYETTAASNIMKVKTANPPLAYFRVNNDTIFEDTLQNARLQINLVFTQFVDGLLPASSFHFKNAPEGLQIKKVIYKNSTSAVLILDFENTDFDTDFENVSIVVDGKEITRDYRLESNTIYLKAKIEEIFQEPTNHVSNLRLLEGSLTKTSFYVAWDKSKNEDNINGLLVIVDTATIIPPTDGKSFLNTDEQNTTTQKKIIIDARDSICFIANCLPATTYKIAVFPFSNLLTDIDYKTDNFPVISIETKKPPIAVIQTTIWNEPFDTSLNSTFVFDSRGDTSWCWSGYGNPEGCAQINAYKSGANTDWLLSPKINLTNYTKIEFSFDQARNYANNSGLSVLISTDFNGSSNPEEQGTWIDLTSDFQFPDIGSWDFINAGKTDLSQFSNQSIYLAFRYNCPAENIPAWEIDNLLLTGTVEIDSIETPKFSIDPGTVQKNTEIILTTLTPGAQIYYTLDGSTPDTASLEYSAPIVLQQNTTINAVAVFDTFFSRVVNGFYKIEEPKNLIPQSPVAHVATNITSSSFIANWDSVTSATNYFIDVATDSLFTSDTVQNTGILISEYIEGGAYNKAIEIVNASETAINLSDYKLQKDVNGNNTFNAEINLEGVLSPGEVFVICHPSADEKIKAAADLQNGAVINFNGNDQLQLVKDNNTVVDHFGIAGGNDFAKDKTLVRKPTIKQGNKIWDISEWEVYEKDNFTYLGWHTYNKSAAGGSVLSGFTNFEVGKRTNIEISGLTPNTYYYRVRASNISGTSKNSNIVKVALPNQSVLEVTTLRDVRNTSTGTKLKYTGVAVVTFAQNYRNQLFIQDSTAAILIDDPQNVLANNYNEGDGITNLTGQLTSYNNMLEFVPDSASENQAGSNLPIDTLLIYDYSLIDSAFFKTNEARLVQIPSMVFDVNDNTTFENGVEYDFSQVFLTGAAIEPFKLKFRTTFYDVDYIGTEISRQFLTITGILNSYNGACLTARRLSDFEVGNGGAAPTISNDGLKIFSSGKYVYLKNRIPEKSEITVFNVNGVCIFSGQYFNSEYKIEIDKTGLYILRFKSATKQKVSKVIIR